MNKFCAIIALLFALPGIIPAQNSSATDVESIDNIIAALYEVISGEKGVERDWDRFKNLFIQEARLMPSGKNKEGKTGYRILSPDGYIESSGKWLVENGFFESEISRKTEMYGSMAHVFSTYESRHSASDVVPFSRGINSIQLMHDGNRWWVLHIYWLGETAEQPLPEKYLPEN